MNLTFEVLTAIALWCGVPGKPHSDTLRSIAEVQHCREQLMDKCIIVPKNQNELFNAQVIGCFRQVGVLVK